MLVALTIKFIPQDVLERNRKQAEGIWQNGKPKKWYYAIPVIVIWTLIIVSIILAIFSFTLKEDRELNKFESLIKDTVTSVQKVVTFLLYLILRYFDLKKYFAYFALQCLHFINKMC